MKTCTVCRQEKPKTEFHKHQKSSGFLHPSCKTCRCEDERERRKRPERKAAHISRYENDMAFRAKEMMRVVRKRAKAQKVICSLSDDWLETRLRAGVCEVTGLPFDFTVGNGLHAPSIDRPHARGNYAPENARVILIALNMAFFNRGLEGFLPIACALVDKWRPPEDGGPA